MGGGTPGGGYNRSTEKTRYWNKMAGTSLGARFYRQIKRHPGVSSVPRTNSPPVTLPLKLPFQPPPPRSCFLSGFLNVPKFSQGHFMSSLCNVLDVPATCLGQDHCRVRDRVLKMWL